MRSRNVKLLAFIVVLLLYICVRVDFLTLYPKLLSSSSSSSSSFLLYRGAGDSQSFNYPNFIEGLAANAKIVKWKDSEMKFIILAMTDNSFTEVALNLYISSFKRFNIDNFLFVGGGSKACKRLRKHKIQCFDFWEDPDSDRPNNYGSKEFIRKMNIRTEMILQALRANYSVLHTDLDIIFLKNPMPEIESLLEKFDLAILWDYSSYNAGFLAIRSTLLTKNIYTKLQEFTNKTEMLDDQNALNKAVVLMAKGQENKIHVLDKMRYLCGKSYYEEMNKDFPPVGFVDSCPNCTVVHNNWIVSKEAKIHRFKETAMWYIDEDRYYSDENRKYLLYYNSVLEITGNIKKNEILAFNTGLKVAHMLNRTLIIPRFHCTDGVECPINSLFNVTRFHEAFFPHYRESSFLLNDLVPSSISMKPINNSSTNCSLQPPATPMSCNKQKSNPDDKCIPFNPIPISLLVKINEKAKSKPNKTASSIFLDFQLTDEPIDESVIRQTFDDCSDQVLVLSSLIYVKVKFTNETYDELFENFLDSSLVRATYNQL